MEDLIANRLRELRSARGWTQKEVADRMRANGMRWSPATVGLVETGGQRADRLLDVAALCWVFQVGVGELLAGGDSVDLPSGDQVPLESVRRGLAGGAAPPRRGAGSTAAVRRFGADDPDELDRVARKVSLDRAQLVLVSCALWGTDRPLLHRDQMAGVSSDTPARSAQAKRGHAMRRMLGELRAAVESEGLDQLAARGAMVREALARQRIDYLKSMSPQGGAGA